MDIGTVSDEVSFNPVLSVFDVIDIMMDLDGNARSPLPAWTSCFAEGIS